MEKLGSGLKKGLLAGIGAVANTLRLEFVDLTGIMEEKK